MLNDFLVAIGFQRSITDMCLYFKRDTGGITVVGVYVDDLMATGTSEKRVDEFFQHVEKLRSVEPGKMVLGYQSNGAYGRRHRPGSRGGD